MKKSLYLLQLVMIVHAYNPRSPKTEPQWLLQVLDGLGLQKLVFQASLGYRLGPCLTKISFTNNISDTPDPAYAYVYAHKYSQNSHMLILPFDMCILITKHWNNNHLSPKKDDFN